MLDAILDWALVFLPTVVSAVGVFVSLRAPHSKHHRALRVSLILFGLVVSGVTFWQQSRARSAHAQEVGGLNQNLSRLLRRTDDLERDAKQSRADQQAEIARRQQAERDLAIIVHSSSQSTRAGVAEDIGKSPIKVEVSGRPLPINVEEVKRLLGINMFPQGRLGRVAEALEEQVVGGDGLGT